MKSLGSEIFNTKVIRTDEYTLLASIMNDNGSSTQEIFYDIKLIDDLLTLQKMEIIIAAHRRTRKGKLRKNSSMLDIAEGMIEQNIYEASK
jgi:hypothetical protein